ncbi:MULTISPECIES: T9SS type A sorting domain-containing protein [Bacteroidales]|uniref:T9SS type A sorting domain-containing protein n=1 Tax=Bacteroidales TaxID=171549 RepID=UPI0006D7F27C|nr:T9SS type A sorting domain-containing protein [Gabonia massiliensis]
MKKRYVVVFIFSMISLFYSDVLAELKYWHFIMYGQSLSAGAQSYPLLSKGSLQNTFMMGNQVWYNYGNVGSKPVVPLQMVTVGGEPADGLRNRQAGVLAESPLYGFITHFQKKTNYKYNSLVTSCGYHGRTIEQLSKGSSEPTLYGCFQNAINSASVAVKAQESEIMCPAIFWLQGENNYSTSYPGYVSGSLCTDDKDEYKEWLLRLKNDMQQDIRDLYLQEISPMFITYQTGGQYIKNKELSISMAQLEAANTYSDIVCAGPVYPMTDRGGHLDPNGYRWYGEMLGKVFYKTQIEGKNFSPLQPKAIYRTENPNELKIQFQVPVLPLVFDEYLVEKQDNYGFELYLNGRKCSISSVRIEGDCVILSSNYSFVGKEMSVSYAGMGTNGHGNLRDSDDYSAYLNYIDLDEKNGDGSYLYSRDATESTLRPSYEPQDKNGIIYGKTYPLYNFSVSFYYILGKDEDCHFTSIDEILIDKERVNVFPNPTTGRISIRGVSPYSQVVLYDLYGKQLALTSAKDIDLSSYHKGIYFVKTEKGMIKIIKK